ncbi:MAG: FHA domain-containing protein [Christensenellales bacterium]|jgi:hypothetical protein
MQMKQCERGHFYNSLRHERCPYCSGEADFQSSFADAIPSVTLRADAPMPQKPRNDGVTVAVIEQQTGIDPVVGWLIALNGESRGKDFRLHAENNFIGRDPRMDVCLLDDISVSRNKHAVISYDTLSGKFYLSVAQGRSIMRVNGEPMLSTKELSAYDEIIIGNTRLMFYPLCSDRFQWSAKDAGDGEEDAVEE